MLEVSVTDTGPGLRADIAARLFEAFNTSKPGGARRRAGHLTPRPGAVRSAGGGTPRVWCPSRCGTSG